MRSLIIAIVIIALLVALCTGNAAAVSARANELIALANTAAERKDAASVEALRERWTAYEPFFAVTVHVERLRACRTALADLYAAVVSGGDIERCGTLMTSALEDVLIRETPTPGQIF